MFRPLLLLALIALGIYLLEPYVPSLKEPIPDQFTGKRPLRLADLNFLHTTDTHGWLSGHLNQNTYNGDWGDFILFAHHLRQKAEAESKDLLIVDLGDRHDGNGLLDITTPNGARSLPIFAQLHYDIITLGNHELYLWENSEQELDLIVPKYGENYVCSNVEWAAENGLFVPFAQRYRYFTTPQQKLRVLSFAFLFDFNRANLKTRVTPIEKAVTQKWFKDVLAAFPPLAVDVIVIVGHIPVTKRWTELQLLHNTLRSAYPDTVIQYFGGHSHIRDFQVFDDKLTALQSGRFCETLGFLSIDFSSEIRSIKDRFFRLYIDFSVDSFMFHTQKDSVKKFHTEKGTDVKAMLSSARADLQLDRVLGHVTQSNYFMDYVPLTHPKNIFRLLTERVLPTLERNLTNEERIIIINTGSVRYDLYKGPYTIDSHFIVSPFENDWVKVSLPKDIALKIAPKLNEREYILSAGDGDGYLKPPHQRYLQSEPADQKPGQSSFTYPDLDSDVDVKGHLSKGYVTFDDFGHYGDDTPHRAVVNYAIPNVVQSLELSPGLNGTVDVVFYSFLIPNVRSAVESLGGEFVDLQFYSSTYLGRLLDKFVASNKV
ncbi:2',3'-cyclic-nucleotide 2'-phosphodiesterase/5'- or 3'-nucleotidase, 5'-nucleotidase family [Metschnikowia aff. pulcherrima]|uniref:2',3'-cyclic-nucleotide 2'-phosphodiesterase/5'-or 3'-nucleotidase, 5'-nucleotidase family n=1 Tax=Metschnikowia aff. pulcherrima TaxID=2163413 RepID=A0A4P6XUZ2_9ASCO|nr:2',3'-cyclic-nucleotide 2'-phosphodiesterase/5'- or 3'-nucleotidase, 5'-nucleotidase family [Metschnikowia aff. pulcherrima]